MLYGIAKSAFNGDTAIELTGVLSIVATLNIRNLPDDVHARLRLRAARAGRSMEAEARAILSAACAREGEQAAGVSLQDWVDELYGNGKPQGVTEELIAERRREATRE